MKQQPYGHALRLLSIFIIAFSTTCLSANAQFCSKGAFRSRGVCLPCEPGSYKSSEGNDECRQCSAGKYNPNRGSSDYSHCLDCPPGNFNTKAGSASCKKCPNGAETTPGSTQCGKCPPGQEEKEGDCEKCRSGYYNDGSMLVCRRCRGGTFSSLDGRRCVKCPVGTYKDVRHVTFFPIRTCLACPPSTYADTIGTVQCKLCPLGMFSDGKATKCKPCPAGTFRNTPLKQKCVPCPMGTSSLGVQPAGCRKAGGTCPLNTFEKDGECRACLPGERLDSATKTCVKCTGNRVSDGGDATTCMKCTKFERPLNFRKVQEASRCMCRAGYNRNSLGNCVPCRPGNYWDDRPAGAIWSTLKRDFSKYYREDGTCVGCLGMTFSDRPATVECERCPPGLVSGSGATKCVPCPKGSNAGYIFPDDEDYSSDRSALTRCRTEKHNCPIGELRDDSGSCQFQKCPVDSYRWRGMCFQCRRNTFYDKAKNACEECAPNTGNAESHLSQTCKKCKGKGPFLPGCICKKNTERKGNRCVPCAKGLEAIDSKCVKRICPTGQVSNTSTGRCDACGDDEIKKSRFATECTKCPPGQTVGRDLFGDRSDRCVPKTKK